MVNAIHKAKQTKFLLLILSMCFMSQKSYKFYWNNFWETISLKMFVYWITIHCCIIFNVWEIKYYFQWESSKILIDMEKLDHLDCLQNFDDWYV